MTRRRAGAMAGLCLLAAAAPVVATAAPASAAAHQSATAHLTVVHGVRGLVADVWVDGKKVLSSFSPERSAGPLSIAAGTHHLVVKDHASGKVLLAQSFTLHSGEHATAALGLNSAGKPALYLYNDALRSASSHPATLVMRDVADAHGVTAVVDGHSTGTLAAGHQLSSGHTAGTYTVTVVDRSTHKTVVPTQQVPVTAGAVTTLYLIGSQGTADLSWVATTLTPSDVTPTGVQTGNSGLAATQGTPWLPITAIAVGTLGAGAVLTRRVRLRTVARATR